MTLFSAGTGRRSLSTHWLEAQDGDDHARALYHRHYSYKPYADGRFSKLFVGPGEKVVLITETGDALFVWRKFKSADMQIGVNCAVFRNEGPVLSSVLIVEADAIAAAKWPGERLFTYVNPRKVRSANPGFCFKSAGYRATGVTKWNKLIILEKP